MLLCKLASGEEESILSGASVLDRGKFGSWGTTTLDDLIGDSFKSHLAAGGGYE